MQPELNDASPKIGWRTRIGLLLFVISIGWPVLIPILPWLGLSPAAIAGFSGLMLVSAELIMLAAAAISGKEGFEYIKQKVFGLLRAVGPPRKVSPIRYRIGLVMFVIPLVVGWAWPYWGHHLPGFETAELVYAIGFDILLLASLFVLGGDFWHKFADLFRYPDPATRGQSQGQA